MSDSDTRERYSVRLVQFMDGSTVMELTGEPTSPEVLGLLEMYRAVQRMLALRAFNVAQERGASKQRSKKRTTSKERK